MNASEKIALFMKKGILVSPELVKDIDESLIEQVEPSEEMVVWSRKELDLLKKKPIEKSNIKILYNYDRESKKRSFQDFVAYFNNRYNSLEKMLKNRQELDRLTSIQRLQGKRSSERERVSIIGIVTEKGETKNNHIMLEIEDPTGIIKVLILKDKIEIYKEARDIVLDEVIGISGTSGKDIIFADSLVFPDVPVSKEIKKSPEECYAVFISDVEVGSVNFLKQEFERFISWLKGEVGGKKQKDIVSKIKYLFIVGDLVAGVGVYPGQEEELEIDDITKQYEKFAEYIRMIPPHIEIVMCAGNHDAGRITEPQPPLYKDFAQSVYDLPNVTFVSNPSLLRIEESESFAGFDILLYHGFSMPYYADNVQSIREAGGQKRPDLIMQFYLKRRHLAPTHSSNMYIPEADHDPMVIETVPDILATGHIHRTAAAKYKGITMLNCSAWTGATEYQLTRGLIPQPGRAILVNLQDRKVQIMKFLREENDPEAAQ